MRASDVIAHKQCQDKSAHKFVQKGPGGEVEVETGQAVFKRLITVRVLLHCFQKSAEKSSQNGTVFPGWFSTVSPEARFPRG